MSKNIIKKSGFKGSLFLAIVIVFAIVLVSIVAGLLGRSDKPKSVNNSADLVSPGINPQPVEVMKIPVEASWEVNNVAFTIKNAYLTPDIADIGLYRANYDIGKTNKFLVIEIDVRNRRTTGSSQKVDVNNYLRIRLDSSEYIPIENSNKTLLPQEDTTVYAIFAVPITGQNFTLLSGPLKQPRVSQLDFGSSEVIKIEGVFLLNKGYRPSFPTD